MFNPVFIEGSSARHQGKIDLSDPETSEEMRLELEGVHFVSNGSLYAFAEPNECVLRSCFFIHDDQRN